MRNEKKENLKLFTVRLPQNLINDLETYIEWRKKNKYTLDTIQDQVRIAIENHLKKVK